MHIRSNREQYIIINQWIRSSIFAIQYISNSFFCVVPSTHHAVYRIFCLLYPQLMYSTLCKDSNMVQAKNGGFFHENNLIMQKTE